MTVSTQQHSLAKALLRKGWRTAQFVHALLTASLPRSREVPRVFYGGARRGNLGGPLVKVKRLQQYFQPCPWTYNMVYLLSNAPYLPGLAIDWMKLSRIPLVLNQNGVFYPGWYAVEWQS